ncbi:MAG: class I SAM-dependent methyltransferase [Planctomycetota bacterium]
MPFAHDRPSLESAPDTHDAEAIAAGSTERDVRAALAALDAHHAPDGPLLDIGCGTGRHTRALRASTGRRVCGVDLDERMLDAARAADPHRQECYRAADAAEFALDERFAAACLFNHSLVCFHSHRLAWGLFTSVARHLLPGGLFLIDNCCTALWDQVREGLFADGLSPDGLEQLFFLPGENRFVWRRGSDVDPQSWQVRPTDRIYRLWSLGEVALAAAGSGLTPCQIGPETPLLVLRSPED